MENHYHDQLISSNNTNNPGYNRIPQNEEPQPSNQPGFFTRWVVRPLAYVGSFFCSKCFNKNVDRRDDDDTDISLNELVLKEIPGKVDNTRDFNLAVKTLVGVLILYNNSDLTAFRNLLHDMNKEEHSYIKEILMENYRNYSVRIDSVEGKRVFSIN